jgi:hypothetical protein
MRLVCCAAASFHPSYPPPLVEAIVEGRQPANLTAEAVTRHIEIPLEWRSQKTALNIQ